MSAPLDELGLILHRAEQWQNQGHKLAMATVVRTWGSAPRRTGSLLLIRDDGLFEGSVSGGCVEGAVIHAALEQIKNGGGRLLQFGVSSDMAWQAGLACGGEIHIFVQSVDETGLSPTILQALQTAHLNGQPLQIAIDYTSGKTHIGLAGDFTHRYDPPQKLVLVGAVHISQALAPIAASLGMAVHIVDPRSAFGAQARFAGFSVDERWPDEAMADWQLDGSTAVVCLTHDPKLDDPALTTALKSPAYYIAALGSRRTHASRLERLQAQGFTPDDLARIHGPAGLSIGAANPAEIAISIMAQMIEQWRAKVGK